MGKRWLASRVTDPATQIRYESWWRLHVEPAFGRRVKYPPRPCTLPWEKLTGRPRSHNILFRWGDGNHVRYRTYSEQVWKPAIARAGIIPEPGTDKRGRKRYVTTRKEGPHQCRHYYASVMLADGVSVKSWRSTSATTTRPSRCGSIPICCLVPMTAPSALSTRGCSARGQFLTEQGRSRGLAAITSGAVLPLQPAGPGSSPRRSG